MRDGKIAVRHTVQMGHRLWSIPGLCTQLHGHTWDITLTLAGPRDSQGLMPDYHRLKKEFRKYLDEEFDHRLCLDYNDPLLHARPRITGQPLDYERQRVLNQELYPGLKEVNFLPSTENLCELWASEMQAIFGTQYIYTVSVWEGDKNWAEITLERDGDARITFE